MFIPKRLVIDCTDAFSLHCDKCISASRERTRVKADGKPSSGFEVASCCICLHVLHYYTHEQWIELAARFSFKLYDNLMQNYSLPKGVKKKLCSVCKEEEEYKDGKCEECYEWITKR